MNREKLREMGLTEDLINEIMRQNGLDIENAKKENGDDGVQRARADQLQEQLNTMMSELREAQESASGAAQLKKDLANMTERLDAVNKSNDIRRMIESECKPKDLGIIMKLLDNEKIVRDENGNYTGIKEQLDALKDSSSYLFCDTADERGGNPNAGTSGKGFDMNAFLRS